MDIRILMVQIASIFLISAQDSIYKLKHICPPQLTITLRRYHCVYYEPTVTPTPVSRNGGIIAECCRNMCSEYYLITSYCKRSTIDYVTEKSELLNQIVKEMTNLNEIKQIHEEEVTENINNALLKETEKVSNKMDDVVKRNSNKTNRQTKNRNKKLKNQKRININGNCVCTCKKRKRKEEDRTDKPAVIVFSKISSNAPILIRKRY